MVPRSLASAIGTLAICALAAGCSALGPRVGFEVDRPRVTAGAGAQAIPDCGPADLIRLPPDAPAPRGASNQADRETLADLPSLNLDEARATGHMDGVPDTIQGRPLRALAGDDVRVIAYFTDAAFDVGMTRAEFLRGGGYVLGQTLPGRPDIADVVVEEVGDLAIRVDVGPYPGAMTHGVEVAEGLRPFSLWWSDETSEWSLRAATETPEEGLAFARAVACGG